MRIPARDVVNDCWTEVWFPEADHRYVNRNFLIRHFEHTIHKHFTKPRIQCPVSLARIASAYGPCRCS
jgi:hypothetical protein